MSSLLVFNRVYRLEIQSVMLVFSIPLMNLRHSNLLTVSPHLSSLCEGWDQVVWRAYTGGIQCVFDQIQKLQKQKNKTKT